MVEKARLWEAADGMVARREVVSARSLRHHLPSGGSLEDINPLLAEWRRERNYFAPLATLEMTDSLARALAATVRGLRRQLDASAGERADQLLGLIPKVTGHLEQTYSTLSGIARLHDENVELRARLAELEATAARRDEEEEAPRGRPKGTVQSTLSAFWDAVMSEIYVLLDRPMSPEEIARFLDRDTVTFAEELGIELKPSQLLKKMRIRVKHRRYFEEPEPGLFARRSDWLAPTRLKGRTR